MCSRASLFLVFVLVGCNDERIAKLEQQNQELQQQLASIQRSNELESRARGAQDAKPYFREHFDPSDKTALVDYTAHYNTKQGKCFIQVDVRLFLKNNGTGRLKWLHDVYENKRYASFSHQENAKGEIERVMICDVNNSKCGSLAEYETAVGTMIND